MPLEAWHDNRQRQKFEKLLNLGIRRQQDIQKAFNSGERTVYRDSESDRDRERERERDRDRKRDRKRGRKRDRDRDIDSVCLSEKP